MTASQVRDRYLGTQSLGIWELTILNAEYSNAPVAGHRNSKPVEIIPMVLSTCIFELMIDEHLPVPMIMDTAVSTLLQELQQAVRYMHSEVIYWNQNVEKKIDPKDRSRYVITMKNKLITALDETSEPYIHHFQIWTGKKYRHVAEPFEPLKSALAEDNERILALYESLIRQKGLQDIPQAYRHNHGVHTNAVLHAKNRVWYRFDFKGFYDTVRFEDFAEYLKPIYPDILTNAEQYKHCFIDPRTNGLIQGSPTSGTLAGIALIKFWIELKQLLPEATITQYSDDLCISGVNLNQHNVQSIVKTCIKLAGLAVKLNTKKTRTDKYQYRCLTGVACNNDDIVTCYRKDYRAYRTLLHHMELTDAASVLEQNDITAEKTLGKLNYMLHIDQTGKVEKLMFQYSDSIQQLKNIIIEHQRAQQGGAK